MIRKNERFGKMIANPKNTGWVSIYLQSWTLILKPFLSSWKTENGMFTIYEADNSLLQITRKRWKPCTEKVYINWYKWTVTQRATYGNDIVFI